jgi:hypothetical protein
MKEQIEEMAVDLCLIDTCKHLSQEECNETHCVYCEAEALYNAGYRKQSVGEWKKRVFIVFDSEIVGYRCSVCNTTWDTQTPYCPHCGAEMKGGAE